MTIEQRQNGLPSWHGVTDKVAEGKQLILQLANGRILGPYVIENLDRSPDENTVTITANRRVRKPAKESDLTRWKLEALAEWAQAMIEESNSPQYGRDVETILGMKEIPEWD